MRNQAIINLTLLRKNALSIKKKLKKGVKLCAVVKADAYGHGAPVVANHIYDLVDCFAVALVEEGVELRRSGIDKDILVLTPILSADVSLAVEFGLTLTVESKAIIDKIERECGRQKRRAKIHLKFNVGMNRFGVSLEELKELLEYAGIKKRIEIDGMYSHLACPQNKKQLKSAENKFLLANNLVKGYNNKAVCHLSASGGFLMGKQLDMVRIGLLLYGYKPFLSDAVKVKPIMKITSPVLRKRSLRVGDGALYGNYKVKGKKSVQIIRYGYADGLERRAVKGQENNRCMDVTMIEQSGDGAFVTIMGDAESLAKKYKTIPYEILVKAGIRSEKRYTR